MAFVWSLADIAISVVIYAFVYSNRELKCIDFQTSTSNDTMYKQA